MLRRDEKSCQSINKVWRYYRCPGSAITIALLSPLPPHSMNSRRMFRKLYYMLKLTYSEFTAFFLKGLANVRDGASWEYNCDQPSEKRHIMSRSRTPKFRSFCDTVSLCALLRLSRPQLSARLQRRYTPPFPITVFFLAVLRCFEHGLTQDRTQMREDLRLEHVEASAASAIEPFRRHLHLFLFPLCVFRQMN